MKIWMLPSYKQQTPSSRMRVYRIADELNCPTQIIPFNWPASKKMEVLKDVQKNDFVLVQKWRNDFNKAEHIERLNGIKIFDMDDASGDQDALDLAKTCDILFMANHHLKQWAEETFDKPVYLIPTGVDIPDPLYPFNKHIKPSIVIPKYGVDRYIGHIARLGMWSRLHSKYGITLKIMGTTKEGSDEQAKAAIGEYCKTYPLVPFDKFWGKYGKAVCYAVCGIMPLSKNAQGKSAFSVLTLMAAGVPVVCSPYGECDHIIEDGKNGYLADSKRDWYVACDRLIRNPQRRQRMSVEALKTVIRSYTVDKIARKIEKCLKI